MVFCINLSKFTDRQIIEALKRVEDGLQKAMVWPDPGVLPKLCCTSIGSHANVDQFHRQLVQEGSDTVHQKQVDTMCPIQGLGKVERLVVYD